MSKIIILTYFYNLKHNWSDNNMKRNPRQKSNALEIIQKLGKVVLQKYC